MAAKLVRRSCRRKSPSLKAKDIAAVVFSVALTGVAVPALLAPSAAFAGVKPDTHLLTAFAGDEVVSATELDKQRGGFVLPTGGLVNFGLEIQDMVNGTIVQTFNAVNMPAGGVNVASTANGGLTKFDTMITNGVISTTVQNAANNQAIQTITTLNISTQGFQTALHQVTQTAQILNTIQMNSWVHH